MRPFTLNLCNDDEEFVLLSSLLKSAQTSACSTHNDSCNDHVCGGSEKLLHERSIADNLCCAFEKSFAEHRLNPKHPATLHISDDEFDLLHRLIKSARDSAFSAYKELHDSPDFEKFEKSRHELEIAENLYYMFKDNLSKAGIYVDCYNIQSDDGF